jgi:PKD repeat protein/Zn-dependent protease
MQTKLPFLFVLLLVFCTAIPASVSAETVTGPGSGFIVVASAPEADFYTTSQVGAAPFHVSFFDRSEGTLPLFYLWDFGDGTTSVEQNPTHIYTRNGDFTVTLTVTNSFGRDTMSETGYIAVGDPPIPDFTASPIQGKIPLAVTFTGVTNTTVSAWRWDFGDGSFSSGQNPSHTYTKPGLYTITLTAGNEFGTGQITKSGIINTGVVPEAEFIAESREGYPPLTVRFRDFSSGNPLTWSWDFGDGSTSTEKDPVHIYSHEGSYTTTLQVANTFGRDSLARPDHIRVGNPMPASTPGSVIDMPPLTDESQPEGIIGLIREAKGSTEKDLPTSGFIPPQFMALAAVLTSFAILFIQFLISNVGTLFRFAPGIAKFLANLAGGHAVEKVSAAEIEKRGIVVHQRERHFLGLSAIEILVIEVATIMLAFAFILADRAELNLQNVLIYILVGAISVVLHDFAHRYFATRYGHDADTQFWGLGTGIMFLTAWLYGNAFAQSYRNIMNREGEDEPRRLGVEAVAGPCVSIVLMILFLALMHLGGLWAVAGGVGFSINLITAVYSLMPIKTMDGGAVWRWNRIVYLALFLPMIAFYFFTYMVLV